MSRFLFLVAGSLVLLWSPPALAAQYERSGDWVFQSKAVAEVGDETWEACAASTESANGTALSLRLERAPDTSFEAYMAISNEAWELRPPVMKIRLDIGMGRRWVVPAAGSGDTLNVAWSFDPHLLPFLEDLASSSEAVLTTWDGIAVARFSLLGSRGAIEAMKACVEEQIGQTLEEKVRFVSSRRSENPF